MSQAALILILTVGGGSGALCRYLLGLAVMKKFPTPRIPIAMIIVNIIGSFGLGILYGNVYTETLYNDALFVFLGLGFFGAFTTFSTFSVEAVQLIMDNKYQHALIYLSLSIFGSIIGFLLGYFIS
ncbi:fluoride efflux transporter CrcB [Sutcliffiella horikoshii]|uniref:Fluoride-specific ion channel FluC n=1 Tax=Sutcliffiella horikoshii TaxID=79883 RepID=A0A1Y0CKE5_9BACI|nr:fluoride efflux transporter CrcB [Sutcliffiella horikoshii]ART75544.1 chromosome condensation protein CrcB [Sutcliffiella horikoshii]TYS60826.1 fluoride efflux transporter CrcB [Sutcliffiella horikoshii]